MIDSNRGYEIGMVRGTRRVRADERMSLAIVGRSRVEMELDGIDRGMRELDHSICHSFSTIGVESTDGKREYACERAS